MQNFGARRARTLRAAAFGLIEGVEPFEPILVPQGDVIFALEECAPASGRLVAGSIGCKGHLVSLASDNSSDNLHGVRMREHVSEGYQAAGEVVRRSAQIARAAREARERER